MLLQQRENKLLTEPSPFMGFNTASGKCCCNYDYRFCQNRLKGGFNTASGKHCCNGGSQGLFELAMLEDGFNTASGKHCCNISDVLYRDIMVPSFNTASGKHCCNAHISDNFRVSMFVSIPQAVSTVATQRYRIYLYQSLRFQYRKR